MAAAMGVIAWRQPAVPVATLPPLPAQGAVPAVELPPTLGPLRQPRIVADADLARARAPGVRAQGKLELELAAPPAGAGVAILDGESFARLAWQRIDGKQLRFDRVPEGSHWIVVALAPEHARFGYVARKSVVIEPGRTARAELDCATFDVEVALPKDADRAEPLAITRLDDPAWLSAPGTPARDAQGALVLRGLAAGTYRIGLATRELTREIKVPETRRVEL